MQADADSAYTQSLFTGTPTWVALPPEARPERWRKGPKPLRNPVCRLTRALYGHPDAGGYWERRCDRILRSKGWGQIADWRSF